MEVAISVHAFWILDLSLARIPYFARILSLTTLGYLLPCSDFGGCHFHPCILDSGFVMASDTLLCSDTPPCYARIPSSTDRVVITPSALGLGVTPFGIPSFSVGSSFPRIPSVLDRAIRFLNHSSDPGPSHFGETPLPLLSLSGLGPAPTLLQCSTHVSTNKIRPTSQS